MGSVVATWLIFFVTCIAASRLGLLFPRIGLPLITGYLIVGAICGPYVLGVLGSGDVPRLSYVNQFALAFISFSAGAELYLPELRALFKRILYQTVCVAGVMFVVVPPAVYLLSSAGLVPFMQELAPGCGWSVAMVLATIMVTLSPASSIAICKELRAKGTFTSTLLGITVLCDVFVLPFFTLATTIAEAECKGEGFSVTALGVMFGTLVVDMIAGYILGKFLILLMAVKRFPLRYLILPLGLAVFVACHWFTEFSHEELPVVVNFEPLLICIGAGYVCTNQSKRRHRFLNVLQQAGPLVFLPFFTVTGASLDLSVLLKAFAFAAIIASIRGVCMLLGSGAGGYLGGQSTSHNALMWLTMITQAGVSLGLASEVAMAFPEFGKAFQTSIISIVLVNQIIGPVLFKIGVRRAGDAGKAALEDEFDADAQIPTALVLGSSPTALTTAIRLLHEKWRVVMVAANPREAAAAKQAVIDYAAAQRAAQRQARGAVGEVVHAVQKPLENVQNKLQELQDKAAGVTKPSTPAVTKPVPSPAVPASPALASARAPQLPALPSIVESTSPWDAKKKARRSAGDPGTGASATETESSDSEEDVEAAPHSQESAPDQAAAAPVGQGAVHMESKLQDEPHDAAHAPESDDAEEHDEEEEHHGPRRPKMEEMFTAYALLADEVPATANPFLQGTPLHLVLEDFETEDELQRTRSGRAPSDGAQGATSGAAATASTENPAPSSARDRGDSITRSMSRRSMSFGRRGRGASFNLGQSATVDNLYAEVIAQIQQTKTLQAVAVVLPTDIGAYVACQVIAAAIEAAPKKSHLHSVRVLAHVHDPAWGPVYDELGIVPVHENAALPLLASKLLTAPVGRPVPVLSAPANNDDLSHIAAQAMLPGEYFWKLLGLPSASAAQPTAAKSLPQHVLAGIRESGGAKAWLASLLQRASFATLKQPLKALKEALVLQPEEVPAWERSNYINQLDALNETVLAGNIERNLQASGAVQATRRDEISMFGSIVYEQENSGEGASARRRVGSTSQPDTVATPDVVSAGGALAARIAARISKARAAESTQQPN